MERICANCGAKSNNEDTRFCTKCGTPYLIPEEERRRTANMEAAKQSQPKTNSNALAQSMKPYATATVVGWMVLFFSFCFGFVEFFNVLSTSQAGMGDVVFIIAYFGLTLLWGIFGMTLVIHGAVMMNMLGSVIRISESK